MGKLSEIFGDKPRIKLLEALIDLAPYKFSLPELAEQAQLDKNVYREINPILKEGLVKRVSDARPANYKVNSKALTFQLVDLFSVIAQASDPNVRTKSAATQLVDSLWDALRKATAPHAEVIQSTNLGSNDPRVERYRVLKMEGKQDVPAQREGETHVLTVGNF